MRSIAHLCHHWISERLRNYSDSSQINLLLTNLLLKNEDLSGELYNPQISPSQQFGAIDEWLALDFRQQWLRLYTFALHVRRNGEQCFWNLLLCALLFREKNPIEFDHLLLLHAVAVHSGEAGMEFEEPPAVESYSTPTESAIERNQIRALFPASSGTVTSLNEYCRKHSARKEADEGERRFKERMEAQYNTLLSCETEKLANEVQRLWNSEQFICTSDQLGNNFELIKPVNAINQINTLLKKWHNNLLLKNFLQNLSQRIQEIQKKSQNSRDPKNSFKIFNEGSSLFSSLEISNKSNDSIFCFASKTFNKTEEWFNYLMKNTSIERFAIQNESDNSISTSSFYSTHIRNFPITNAAQFPLSVACDEKISKKFLGDLHSSWNYAQ